MAEIAGDQAARATNDKAVVRKRTCRVNTILALCPPIQRPNEGLCGPLRTPPSLEIGSRKGVCRGLAFGGSLEVGELAGQ
jgi:hypothetical protein